MLNNLQPRNFHASTTHNKESRIIPVAQYLRMSTEDQRYSIANQQAAIAEYARQHGYQIVRTYQDPGESGLTLKHRLGLQRLLSDVVGGVAEYRTIIVLDVSRWGRFQNPDEAAHYEFICRNAGINVVYCAEEFNNEGTIADYFAKTLKRTLAAEYSYELSVKNFENHKRSVERGFRVGSAANYGFRRMALGADGRAKSILPSGESKVLMDDRVTLVRGPKSEQKCVRLIFQLCLQGKGSSEISRELNSRGLKKRGRPWQHWMIGRILTNPIYTGAYVWNRTTQRLLSKVRRNKPEDWVVNPRAFPPIVSQATFDKAQRALGRAHTWSDEELLERLRRLLRLKGTLSEQLIETSKITPAIATYHRRLGTFERIYAMVGFACPAAFFQRCRSRATTLSLREGLFRQLEALFPGRTRRFSLARKSRELLEIEGRVFSVIVCRSIHRPSRATGWHLLPVAGESQFMALVCRLNHDNDGFLSFHLFSRMDKTKEVRFTEAHRWFHKGIRLPSLEQLCQAADRMQPAPPANLAGIANKGKCNASGSELS